MADQRTVYEALFSLAGKMDKSLISAAKDARNLLKSLDLASGATDKNVQKVLKDLGNISATSARIKAAAHEFGSSWSAAASKVHKAFEPLHRSLHTLGEFTGIGAALGAVGGAFGDRQGGVGRARRARAIQASVGHGSAKQRARESSQSF